MMRKYLRKIKRNSRIGYKIYSRIPYFYKIFKIFSLRL